MGLGRANKGSDAGIFLCATLLSMGLRADAAGEGELFVKRCARLGLLCRSWSLGSEISVSGS